MAIKPIARDLADADRVVAAVQGQKARYFPNDAVRRFTPANRQAKAWIDEGRIGDLLAVHNVFSAGLPRDWPDATVPGWFADPARAAGGAFIDHAVYHVDVQRWLFGAEVRDVTGMMANVRYKDLPLEDWGHAVLRFESGQMGSIEDTWTSGPGAPREAIEIVGSRGSIINDTATGRMALTGDFGLSGWLQVAPPAAQSAYIEHVIRCLRGEEPPASTVEDARANLAACLAVYESARTGQVVAPSPSGVGA
jgi:predicted dehydrogenase